MVTYFGAMPATCMAMSFTSFWKSSLRATKSVSEFTSTATPVPPSTATATRPSAAVRPAFLSAFARPFVRSQSMAASMSPPVSVSAFTGDEIDLTQFPFIQTNPADGGRYVNSGSHFMVDSEMGPNFGTYRCQLKGPRKLGVNHATVLRRVAACEALADEFLEVLEKDQLAARLEPLW